MNPLVNFTINGKNHSGMGEWNYSGYVQAAGYAADNTGVSITYTMPDGRDGILEPGRRLDPVEGMRMTAIHTGNA